MTRREAVSVAVARVEATSMTFFVLRRGYKYDAQTSALDVPRGWSVAEMIGPGNVHNFKPAA